MFLAVLFIIPKRQNQFKCPSAGEQVNKLWYVYALKYDSVK